MVTCSGPLLACSGIIFKSSSLPLHDYLSPYPFSTNTIYVLWQHFIHTKLTLSLHYNSVRRTNPALSNVIHNGIEGHKSSTTRDLSTNATIPSQVLPQEGKLGKRKLSTANSDQLSKRTMAVSICLYSTSRIQMFKHPNVPSQKARSMRTCGQRNQA